MDANDTVAIVGAGVSGLLTAIALKKKGVKKIRLYEREGRVANLTHSLSHGGRTFDYATKLIPTMTFYSPGVYPPLRELYQEVGMTAIAPPIPKFYDLQRGKTLALPPTLAQYGKLKVIADFARGYTILAQLKGCRSMADVYRTGIINPDENIAAWGERQQLQSVATLANYIIDLFNMGPAQDVPAAFAMVSRIHFLAPYFHAILSKPAVRLLLKFTGPKHHAAFDEFIRYPRQASNYLVFKEGYEEFFRRLAGHYELDIVYNAAISQVRAGGDELSFLLNDSETVACDKLVFCCPPQAIAELTPHAAVRDRFAGVQQKRLVRTWAFTVKSWDAGRFGAAGYAIDGGSDMDIGGAGFASNGELMYIARDYADSDLIMSAVCAPFSMTEDHLHEALVHSLAKFGMELKEVVGHRDFVWPSHPDIPQCAAGWYEAVEEHQGRDNIYYSGECMSGIGVPTILEYALKFADGVCQG